MKRYYIIAIAIVFVVGVYYFFIRKAPETNQPIFVTKGTIVQDVRVTGKIKAAKSVNLAFERSGNVNVVNVDIGSIVYPGQVLMELDMGELRANLNDAQAYVDVQTAKLEELKKGTRPEELAVSQSKVDSAQSSLQDAKQNLTDVLKDSNTKSDDAIYNKSDPIFINPRISSPQLNISVNDFSIESYLETNRLMIGAMLSQWDIELSSLSLSSDLATYAKSSQSNIRTTKDYLDKVASAVNSLTPDSRTTQTQIDTYRTNVSTARTNISTAISNITTAVEKLRDAESSLELAKKELLLSQAGNTAEQISAQEATVKQAQAKVATIQAQMNGAILRSPLAGIVTKKEISLGESASAHQLAISVISQSNLEIEAQVPEVDVGNITIGNRVSITLDAFSGETFTGHVTYIEPGETIIDGVVNFKVTIAFDKNDTRFKSGLTANLTIDTLKKDNVLMLPQFAILENDSGTFVRKISNGKTIDVPVSLGIHGQNGMIEIISGVTEGEQVVNVGLKSVK